MRVLLVQPDFVRAATGGSLGGSEIRSRFLPARSLIQLSSLVEQRGHEARVLDPLTALALSGDREVNMEAATKAALEREDFDAVGVAVYTSVRKEARAVAAAVKSHDPDIPVIAGGPHPARLAKSMLKNWREFDYAIMGAAEESFPALLDALQKKSGVFKLDGIAFRYGHGRVRQRGRPALNVDISALPPISYDRYLEAVGEVERAYIMTSRGCPYWCNFCSNLWKKVLLADPEKTAEEAGRLVRDAGVKTLTIYDDCFGAKAWHAEAVLRALRDADLGVELQAVTRFDVIEEGWLRLFKQAGGRDVIAGIETGSQKLRRKMNKHMKEGSMCRGAELVRSEGLRLGVYVMFGFPAEDPPDVSETYWLLKKLDPDQVMATVFEIKPGDMLFEFALSANMLSPAAWTQDEPRSVNEMTRDELIEHAARAEAFEKAFTRERLFPEHDPAGFVLGLYREPGWSGMMEQETKRWKTNAA